MSCTGVSQWCAARGGYCSYCCRCVQTRCGCIGQLLLGQMVIQLTTAFRSRNDHTNMTAPHPVCSAKLSMFGPGQYYGGGPRWNPRCCSFASYLSFACEACFSRLMNGTHSAKQKLGSICYTQTVVYYLLKHQFCLSSVPMSTKRRNVKGIYQNGSIP